MTFTVTLPQTVEDFRKDRREFRALIAEAARQAAFALYGGEPCVGYLGPISDKHGYTIGQIEVRQD